MKNGLLSIVAGLSVVALSALASTAAADGARSGEAIYKKACITCHATGVAGAPKFGDAAGWTPRIEKGVDVLYTSVIKGLNGMPAKGMCFDCSDEELKASVDYIIEQSK